MSSSSLIKLFLFSFAAFIAIVESDLPVLVETTLEEIVSVLTLASPGLADLIFSVASNTPVCDICETLSNYTIAEAIWNNPQINDPIESLVTLHCMDA